MTEGYDHRCEYEQGREDALHGFPRRLGQTAPYRQGYDRGLTEYCAALAAAREEN